MIDGFSDEETQDEAMRCIRSLIDKILIRPNAAATISISIYTGALVTILLFAVEAEPRFTGKKVTDSTIKRAGATKRNRGLESLGQTCVPGRTQTCNEPAMSGQL